jgi:predicted nucleic acid-binding protein
MADVFLDTSYIVALASPADQHHADALRLSDQLENGKHRLVTTRGVVLEIGNALSRQRLRATAIHFLARLRNDPSIEVIEVDGELFEAGFDLYRRRSDKEWSLTDCLSFVVMWERRIADALTADRHFRQAGFRPLLDSPRG